MVIIFLFLSECAFMSSGAFYYLLVPVVCFSLFRIELSSNELQTFSLCLPCYVILSFPGISVLAECAPGTSAFLTCCLK
ncbi:hypothetical protein G97194_004750 [Escherichia coli]|nr:hypothetical protein G97194_004750 [Escherichia coli]